MLPNLKKKEGSASMQVPDHVTRKPDEGVEYDVMHAAAEDLIKAIHSHDVQGCAEALRAAFDLSQPESEPIGEDSV